jgi:hypothetical protein
MRVQLRSSHQHRADESCQEFCMRRQVLDATFRSVGCSLREDEDVLVELIRNGNQVVSDIRLLHSLVDPLRY